MGKKNKKSRRYDHDDILGGPLPANQEVEPLNEDDHCRSLASATATDAKNSAPSPPPVNPKKKGKTSKQKVVDIDLIKLEETMIDILRNHGGNSDEWLYRTIEKNMHLPKKSLRQSLEIEILVDMMTRLQQRLDQEDDAEESKKIRWDALVSQTSKKSELTETDKAKLRAQARELGVGQEETVAIVAEAIRNTTNKKIVAGSRIAGGGGHDDQAPVLVGADGLDANNTSLPVSILLYLHPYVEPSGSLLGKIHQYVCFLLYTIGSFLFGHQAKTQAKILYESIHLPAMKAVQLTRETEEDEYMLKTNTHLWSNQQQCWVEKDATYSNLPTSSTPPTIRCSGGKWERWSKNLKTRTKAMKLAEAEGMPISPLTKGTFVPVRAGEGWATAPSEPEVESDEIIRTGIRFLACLPSPGEDEIRLDVVDVTSWAVKSLLPTEAARKLGAVDSGRELFSFDVSTLQHRAKNTKKKKQNKVDKEKEEENVVAKKGIGFEAKLSKKYLAQMQKDME